jgi:hypothetical protein
MEEIFETEPLNFLKFNRFDVCAKLIYAKFRELGYNSKWGEEIYKSLIKVWNNFDELCDSTKKGEDVFINRFNGILDSIKNNKFIKNYPIIVDENYLMVNGSHRLASSIYYGINCFYRISKNAGREGQWQCDSEYFRTKCNFVPEGLKEKYLDAMAIEYSFWKKNTFIAVLFPSANGKEDQVENLLNSYSKIICIKQRQKFSNKSF